MTQAQATDPIAPILLRAMGVGALLGFAAAVSIGIAASSAGLVVYGPILGTLIGTVVGVANGIGLFGAMMWTQSRLALRIVAALGSAIGASGLAALAGRPDSSAGLIFAGCCALAGFAIGPFVAYGRRSSIAIPFGKIAAYGGSAGLAIGGITGLIIGVMTFLPTAPVAAVEGGLLGAVPGALLALLVATPVMCFTQRCRRAGQ